MGVVSEHTFVIIISILLYINTNYETLLIGV